MSNLGQNKIDVFDTAWRDINLGGAVLAAVPGQQPDRDEFVDENGDDTGIDTYAIAVGEAVDGSFELDHDYLPGSDLYFHVHWQGIDSPSGTDYVRWRLTYAVSSNGDTLNAPVSIEVETAVDTQYSFNISDFAAIVGTSFNFGDQFLFKLERIASSGDAYSGDALLATLGVHIQVNTIGSGQIGNKYNQA